MSNKYFVTKSAISFAGIDKDTYLTAVGISDPDIAVDKLISNNCISSDLNSGYFDNSAGQSEFKGSINIVKESYEGQVIFDSYKTTASATPITAILPGTSPHFNKKLVEISTPGTYAIKRTATTLSIGGANFTAADFADGVIPLRLIVVLQGAGGGGNGNNGPDYNGSGGGSGALNSAIISLVPQWTFQVGTGGTGGSGGGWGGADNNAAGGNGGDTYLSTDGSKLTAGGGKGASAGSVMVSGAGGSGGTPSIVQGSYILKQLVSASGSAGGKGADGVSYNAQYGGKPTNKTITCNSRNSDTQRSITLEGKDAGVRVDHSDGNMGGTGAGSWFGKGGNAVWSTGGTAGESGAGGGGGSWDVFDSYTGGNGGNGVAVFYY